MTISNYFVPTKLRASYSFALLADMHSRIPQGFLRTLAALAPDFIILAGDIVDIGFEKEPHMLSFLAGCASLAPTYYATGNHELFTDTDRELVTSLGIALLENNDSTFADVRIGGLASGLGHTKAFRKTPPPDLAFLDRFEKLDSFKLLISHHPEHYPRYIRERAIDLTVSGHAHGGQWRIGSQGIFAPGQGLFPKYT
ncbi:MAG: metallophosphoesterase, partial [Clostridia bacterium]|nr:metallophosphoesterase [Clostridia bacterium]